MAGLSQSGNGTELPSAAAMSIDWRGKSGSGNGGNRGDISTDNLLPWDAVGVNSPSVVELEPPDLALNLATSLKNDFQSFGIISEQVQ